MTKQLRMCLNEPEITNKNILDLQRRPHTEPDRPPPTSLDTWGQKDKNGQLLEIQIKNTSKHEDEKFGGYLLEGVVALDVQVSATDGERKEKITWVVVGCAARLWLVWWCVW